MTDKLPTSNDKLVEVELNPFQTYLVNSKVLKITPNKELLTYTLFLSDISSSNVRQS